MKLRVADQVEAAERVIWVHRAQRGDLAGLSAALDGAGALACDEGWNAGELARCERALQDECKALERSVRLRPADITLAGAHHAVQAAAWALETAKRCESSTEGITTAVTAHRALTHAVDAAGDAVSGMGHTKRSWKEAHTQARMSERRAQIMDLVTLSGLVAPGECETACALFEDFPGTLDELVDVVRAAMYSGVCV